MPRCLMSLGANLGDLPGNLARACGLIDITAKCRLIARSAWHETTAIGAPADAPQFLNGAVLLETSLPPRQLLQVLLAIEDQFDRQRQQRWDSRTLDIDLLLYDHQQSHDAELRLPHPWMSVRRFVLEPACDIAGSMVHPTSGWTLAALLGALNRPDRTVQVAAATPEVAQWLHAEIMQHFGDPRRQSLPCIELERAAAQPAAALRLIFDPSNVQPFCGASELSIPSDKKIEAFRRRTATPVGGPHVRIEQTEPTAVIAEAVAAIHAAWPDCIPAAS